MKRSIHLIIPVLVLWAVLTYPTKAQDTAPITASSESTLHFATVNSGPMVSIPASGETLQITTRDGSLTVSLKDGSVKTTGAITTQGAADGFWKAVSIAFPSDYASRRRIDQLETAMMLSALRIGHASMQALFNIEMIHARSTLTSPADKKSFSEVMGKLVTQMAEVESEIRRVEERLGLKPGEPFKP